MAWKHMGCHTEGRNQGTCCAAPGMEPSSESSSPSAQLRYTERVSTATVGEIFRLFSRCDKQTIRRLIEHICPPTQSIQH
jgi:hypothetical protein